MQRPAPDAPEEFAWIEGLRGLAAVLVLVTHYVVFIRPEGAGPWGLAATGVDVFFVLSGFVFARTLAQPHLLQPRHLLPHLVRRLFRLYPLYLVALLAYAGLRPEAGRWEALPEHLLMLHTTGSLSVATAYNVAFWSLPPEVEFYLLLPLLALVAPMLKGGLWGLLMLALGAKLWLVSLAQPGESLESLRSVLTVHAPGLLVEFLLGSAVAVWGGHVQAPALGRPWPRAWRVAAGWGGLMALVALCVVYARELSTPALAAQAHPMLSGNVGLWTALACAGLMLWAPSAAVPTSSPTPFHALLSLALWVGRLSYGVYLFHNAAPVLLQRLWPALNGWALVAASTALTVLVAALLHRLIEAPARSLGRALASGLGRAISTRMSGGMR